MWPPDHIPPSPADRAREGLLDDATRSNREIAIACRTTPAIVASARRQLTDLGVLPASPLPPRRFPAHKALPRPPRELAEGACASHPRPDLWTDPGSAADREYARMTCRFACSVVEVCLEFALALPEDDLAIYAATTASDRIHMRLARAGRPTPIRMTAAGKNAARDRRRRAARQGQQEDAAS